MQELRQSTSIIIKVGPVVNSTGITPVTNLTVSGADEAEILKNGTTATLAISGTLTAITNCDGWYNLTLASTDPSALGPMKLVIQDDSACLPVWMDFMVVTQEYYDTKYNSTGSFKASLTAFAYSAASDFMASVTGYSTFDASTDGVTLGSAAYASIGAFHASVTGYSTFDASTDGVTLGSAAYASIGAFHASVTGYSTFDPAATGVTLASATYTTVTSFHASVTGYSTFDPVATGVTLASAAYSSIGAFQASVTGYSTFDASTDGVTLASAVYDSIGSFQGAAGTTSTDWTTTEKNQIRKRLGIDGTSTSPAATPDLSTFDPSTDGVTLGSAAYDSVGAFKADVSGLSTFDPASSGVTLGSAVYASIGAFRLSVSDIISGVSDGAYDLQEMMRLMFAALCGKVSGGSTTTITFRNSADDTNRIVATVDANGNRTAVTLDGS